MAWLVVFWTEQGIRRIIFQSHIGRRLSSWQGLRESTGLKLERLNLEVGSSRLTWLQWAPVCVSTTNQREFLAEPVYCMDLASALHH